MCHVSACSIVSYSPFWPFAFPPFFPVFPSLFLSLTPSPAVLSLSLILLFHMATRPFLCVICPSFSALWWLPWCSQCHTMTTKSPALIFLLLFVCLDVLLFLFPAWPFNLDHLCSFEIHCCLRIHFPVLQNMLWCSFCFVLLDYVIPIYIYLHILLIDLNEYTTWLAGGYIETHRHVFSVR